MFNASISARNHAHAKRYCQSIPNVRNLRSFNLRPKSKPLSEQETDLPREEDIIIPEKLSYVVVIVENLERLMQAAPVDTETAIAHITQMARPTGIHLIMATRPASKSTLSASTLAEIPFRIAFRCESRIDSRSIIGMAGAERLFGRGDMLCLPPGSGNLKRAQGALITDKELEDIVGFIAQQAKPSYEAEIHKQLSNRRPTPTSRAALMKTRKSSSSASKSFAAKRKSASHCSNAACGSATAAPRAS